MKIIVVKKSFLGFGGGTDILWASVRSYLDSGYEVEVLVSESKNNSHYADIKNLVTPIINVDQFSRKFHGFISAMSFFLVPLTLFLLAKKTKKRAVNESIIHIHESLGSILAAVMKVLFGMKQSKIVWTQNDFLPFSPYTHGFRSILRFLLGKIYIRIENYCSKYVDLVCVLDQRSYDYAISNFGSNCEIIINPLVIDFDSTVAEMQEDKNILMDLGLDQKSYVLCNASYSKHRRFQDVVSAVAQLNNSRNSNISVVIVGDSEGNQSYVDELALLAEKLNLRLLQVTKRLHLHDLNLIYTNSYCFCFVGEKQTWGLAPLRSVMLGVSTIVSTGCGVSRILEPVCDVVETGDVSQIVAALESPKEINNVQVKSLKQNYSRNNYTNRILSQLTSL